jgi:hypothetical protein
MLEGAKEVMVEGIKGGSPAIFIYMESGGILAILLKETSTEQPPSMIPAFPRLLDSPTRQAARDFGNETIVASEKLTTKTHHGAKRAECAPQVCAASSSCHFVQMLVR